MVLPIFTPNIPLPAPVPLTAPADQSTLTKFPEPEENPVTSKFVLAVLITDPAVALVVQ